VYRGKLLMMDRGTVRNMEEFYSKNKFEKLVHNLYDIYHCCVYSGKLLMMDRGTVRNMEEFYSKNKFEKSVHLVGFIIRIYHDARSSERQIREPRLHVILLM